jgi:hypothetical protein
VGILDFSAAIALMMRSAEFIPQQAGLSTMLRNKFRAPEKSQMRNLCKAASN